MGKPKTINRVGKIQEISYMKNESQGIVVLDDTELSGITGGDGAGLETAAGGAIGLGVCAVVEPCGVVTAAVAGIAFLGGLAWWLLDQVPGDPNPCRTTLDYPGAYFLSQ